ncbi:hypothetical protein [Sphingobacterium corticibacter]|uniref:Phage tail tape measure protein n=1 Tax=Sphingobacterium corticibacter TaxID=2171749 RepID=A0A2T8HLH1_9SPHI|nr:hypothetical protein [Sphingobacterium corticibacter]PVH26294.1 hypothetical protein DC487_01315 [Sphingobacterium corticibacter]
MAIELNGKPLKFTAEFDSKQAEQSIEQFLGKLKKMSSKNIATDSVDKVASKASEKYENILSGATSAFNAFSDSSKDFYTNIAQGEMQLQKIRNEQNALNKELRQGLVTDEEYIKKTAQLNKVRDEFSRKIKQNKADLQQYAAAQNASNPKFTRQDTLNELAGAHTVGSGGQQLNATDALAAVTQQSLDKLNAELLELDKNLKKGAITNEEYAKSAGAINNKIKEVTLNQEHFNQNAGKNALPAKELQQQKDILDVISEEYKEMVEDATSAFQTISTDAKFLNNKLAELRQESKDLNSAQKQLDSAYKNGEITQKQYLQGSRDLGVQQNEVRKRISETRNEINQLDNAERKSIGSLAEKTARLTQIQQKYSQLSQEQRENIHVGGKLREEYRKISAEVQKLNNELSGTKSQGIGNVFNSIRGIAGAMGIAFGAQQLISFGKELFSIAREAEGIELRFAKIGDTTGLEKLRTATRNTVSDLELMKLAVNADNFRIPMDVLAKGLEFATRRASETGQSVDYLVNSFVTGLGRKSKLILDNLGISATELNEEIQKTGDFATGVGNIIDREMRKSGEAVDTLSEKTNRLSTIWQNFKKDLSSNFNKVFNPGAPDTKMVEKLTQSYKQGFEDIRKYSTDTRRAFVKDQEIQLASINSQLSKLVLNNPEFDKIYQQERRAGRGQSPQRMLDDMRKPLIEQQQALQASLSYAKGITAEMATQERQSKNIFSQNELEEKLSDAQNLYKNAIGDKARAEAKKEVDKWQKLLDGISIKSLSSASKKSESEAKRLAKELAKDNEDRTKLLDQWAKTDAGYLNKQLSRDEQEVQSVKDKYAEIKKAITEHNRSTKGDKVSLDGFDESVTGAVVSVKKRQTNDNKIKQYQEDYQNYVRYEQLKKDAGQAYAEEQYGSFKNVVTKMQQEMNALQGKKFSQGLSPIEESYLKDLEEQQKAHIERVKEESIRQYTEALQLSMGHDENMLAVRKRYQDAYATLGESATESQKNTLKEGLKEELSALTIANLEKEANWEKTFGTLQYLSKKASLQVLKDIQTRLDAELKAGKLTRQDYDRASNEVATAGASINLEKSWSASTGALNKYREAIKKYGKESAEAKQAQAGMFTALSRDLQMASQTIGEVGGLLASLGASEGIQETAAKVSGLVGSMSDLAAGIASGNPIAIISGSISVLTKVIDLFNTKDKKIQKQIEVYQKRLESLTKTYSKLQDQINNSVGESFYKDSQDAIKNLKTQQKILEQSARAESSKKRADQNKIREYRDQIEEKEREIKEIERAITQNLVQTTFKDLANELTNALVSAFEAGEDAINSMDKVFDQFIKNALVNSLKLKMIEPIINDMIDKVADYMSENDNSIEGFDFEKWKTKLSDSSDNFTEALEKAYEGLGLEKDIQRSDSAGELNKGITTITENTANRLEAEFGGLRIAQLQLLEITKQQHSSFMSVSSDHLAKLNAIENNTFRTANNTDRLGNIETAIVELNKKVTNGDMLKRGAGL